MAKPKFLCIGGQRCGTTRLHRILNAHPEISMTQQGVGEFEKEIHYFDRFVLTHDFDWYESHFPDHGIGGEITPAYSTLSSSCVRLIHQYLPEAKIIYVVRSPVDRIWSQIRMMQSAWHSSDICNFDLLTLVRLFDSPAVHLRSDYLKTYMLWRNTFGIKNILLLTFDDLILFEGLKKTLNFLQVTSEWIPSEENASKVLSSPALEMPRELRWLCAACWLRMLEKFSEFLPSSISWLEEMRIDFDSIPNEFNEQVEEIRSIQSDAVSQRWIKMQNHQDSLFLALLAKLGRQP